MSVLDPATATYIDVVERLLREPDRFVEALAEATRAAAAEEAEALATERRVRDRVTELRERARRLDGEVRRATKRAGKLDSAEPVHVPPASDPVASLDDLEREFNSIERDVVSLGRTLEWLDRNPLPAAPVVDSGPLRPSIAVEPQGSTPDPPVVHSKKRTPVAPLVLGVSVAVLVVVVVFLLAR